MFDSTQNVIYAVTAAICCMVVTAGVIAGPVELPETSYGMQLASGPSAGDGESCPRNPGGEAVDEMPVGLIPRPVQPAIFIEVFVPANEVAERGLLSI